MDATRGAEWNAAASPPTSPPSADPDGSPQHVAARAARKAVDVARFASRVGHTRGVKVDRLRPQPFVLKRRSMGSPALGSRSMLHTYQAPTSQARPVPLDRTHVEALRSRGLAPSGARARRILTRHRREMWPDGAANASERPPDPTQRKEPERQAWIAGLDLLCGVVCVRGRACGCARVCVCVCVNHPFDGSKCFGPPPPYSTLKRKKKQAPRIAKKLGNRRIRLILGVTKAFI